HMKRAIIAALAIATLGTMATAQVANAQTYPTRPITMNVPFAAGGPTDTIARVIAQRMSVTLGQSIIIENVTGADGTIGGGRVAGAAPDGSWPSTAKWSPHVPRGAPSPRPSPFWRVSEPAALLPTNPRVTVPNRGVPATNLKELIDWLKANPERAAMGIGS